MVESTHFRNAMALLSGAVSVITTDGPSGRFGFTASAVCSVTDAPPTLLVCMNKTSYSNQFFRRNGVLCVNLLAAGQQDVSALFSDRTATMDERFSRNEWKTLETGAPALPTALVNFDCDIAQIHEVGSHNIFYCTVRHVLQGESREGLVYFDRSYHRLGDSVAGDA